VDTQVEGIQEELTRVLSNFQKEEYIVTEYGAELIIKYQPAWTTSSPPTPGRTVTDLEGLMPLMMIRQGTRRPTWGEEGLTRQVDMPRTPGSIGELQDTGG
jgi:hypothetical protein